jgi:hypothetical protein
MIRFSNSYISSLAISTDDRSTLSDDDEGISSDDHDNEDISRKAIHRALMVCFISYLISSDEDL